MVERSGEAGDGPPGTGSLAPGERGGSSPWIAPTPHLPLKLFHQQNERRGGAGGRAQLKWVSQ